MRFIVQKRNEAFPVSADALFAAESLEQDRLLPLTLSRTYDSVHAVDGFWGKGWSSNLTGRLSYSTYMYSAPSTYYREAVVSMPNGRAVRYRENTDGVTYTPVFATHDTLVRNVDGSFDLTLAQSRSRYHYSSTGTLLSFTDDYGNALTFTYDGNNRLFEVLDESMIKSTRNKSLVFLRFFKYDQLLKQGKNEHLLFEDNGKQESF